MNSRITTLDALADGTLTLSEAAARLQVSEAQVREWAQLVSLTRELAAHDAPRGRRSRPAVSRRAVVSAAVTLVVAVGLWASRPAWAAAGCAQFLPSPLKTFCSNTPALADEVNANFKALTDALSARTGTFSTTSKDITTTGSLSVGTASTGSLTVTSLQVNGGLTATGSVVGKNFAPAYSSWSETGLTGGAGIVNDNGGYKALMVAGNRSGGATNPRQIQLYDDVTVVGKLRSNGGLSGSGKLCVKTTSCTWTGGFGCGGNNTCPAGQIMTGFQDGTGCAVTNKAYCCKLELDTCP